jgi:hypothetical protein
LAEQQQEASAIDSSQGPVQDKMTHNFFDSVKFGSDWVVFDSTAVSIGMNLKYAYLLINVLDQVCEAYFVWCGCHEISYTEWGMNTYVKTVYDFHTEIANKMLQCNKIYYSMFT